MYKIIFLLQEYHEIKCVHRMTTTRRVHRIWFDVVVGWLDGIKTNESFPVKQKANMAQRDTSLSFRAHIIHNHPQNIKINKFSRGVYCCIIY